MEAVNYSRAHIVQYGHVQSSASRLAAYEGGGQRIPEPIFEQFELSDESEIAN